MTEWLNLLAEMIQRYRWIAPLLALAAGLLTSITPCSLSSIPMAIAYVGGSAKKDTKKAFRLSLTMAVGLALTFLVFGSLASVIGHYMHEIGTWWYVFLGIIMILMALQIWGVIHIIPNHPHDYGKGNPHEEHGCECHDHSHHHEHEHEHKHEHPTHCDEAGGQCHCGPKVSKRGYLGALLAGMLSGAVASHCSTPVMIALLAMAAQSGSTFWGIFLLAMFAVGHSILLVAAGTSYSVVEGWMYNPKYEKISKNLRTIMGVLILVIGFAMIYMAFFYEA
ncbi:MAG: cytochrome c biogenesis protein CcdA [Clostridia bacterium]|nr:cytochrome c biogenesis protein CcdA [Clostridia bacterium]NCC43117.1 cytochrome c biogenesis protein CcdA [Clostridia bacterium]